MIIQYKVLVAVNDGLAITGTILFEPTGYLCDVNALVDTQITVDVKDINGNTTKVRGRLVEILE